MICQTVKSGMDCIFMNKKGCSFLGGQCHEIDEKCVGCAKVFEWEGKQFCQVYPEPAARWLFGICAMATHVKREFKETTQKINPLKASKRAARARKK